MIDPRLGQELGNADREIREAERRIEIAERRVRESINLPGFMLVTEQGRLGATVQNLSPQLGKYFGLEGRTGALVNSVAENSSGARGGLQAGDVIVEVDGAKVTDPRSFVETLRTKEGKVNLLVIRERREMTITVDLGALRNGPQSPTTPSAPKAPTAIPELGSSLYNGSAPPALGSLYYESEIESR
jgi:membrane-associated protease RseP (regulator of RpoE activity)